MLLLLVPLLFSLLIAHWTSSKDPREHRAVSSHFLQVQNLQGWLNPEPPPFHLQALYHTLRSFNYLMQDAEIMPGRHLKEAPAFICWDGSSARREERGLPECHEACWCSLQRRSCLFLPFCLRLSVSFPFWLPFFNALFITFLLWRYGPQES